MDKKKSVQTIMAIIFSILSFISIIILSLSKLYPAVWPMTIVFGISLLFVDITKVSEISIGIKGVKAQMKEVIEEAKITIEELRSLAKIMASSTLGLVKRTGRIGGYSYDEKEDIKKDTLRILSELGVSNKEQEEVLTKSRWHDFVKYDYAYCILGANVNVPRSLSKKLEESVNKKVSNWSSLSNIPKPKDLREILKELGVYNTEAEGLIQDYEHYIIHHEQRRPDIWRNRFKWRHLFTNK